MQAQVTATPCRQELLRVKEEQAKKKAEKQDKKKKLRPESACAGVCKIFQRVQRRSTTLSLEPSNA